MKEPPPPPRLCVRECIKDGVTHDFDGRVKVVLVDEPEEEERSRILGASCVSMANMMIAANLAIIIVYSFSHRSNLYYSGHCLFCIIGSQLCIPLCILVLNPMYGPSAVLKRKQRKLEHILFSLMGIFCLGLGSAAPFLDPQKCTPIIHIYGAYATGGALAISILTGLLINLRKSENECPSFLSTIHRFWGIVALLASTFTYLTSIGGCRGNLRFWLYAIGRQAPLYLIYFMVVFYTLIIVFVPGSKFILRTKYNYRKC